MIPIIVNSNILDLREKHVQSVMSYLENYIDLINSDLEFMCDKLNITTVTFQEVLSADNRSIHKLALDFNGFFDFKKGVSGIYHKCGNNKLRFFKGIEEIVKSYKVFASAGNYIGVDGDYNAITWLKELDVKACSYCNRSYIETIGYKRNNIGSRVCEIDHFYAQSVFPHLSLSFFNLIPSCSHCNKIKGTDLISWYPFQEKGYKIDDEYIFYLNPKDNNNGLAELDRYELEVETYSDVAEEFIDVMYYKEAYQCHVDFANEIAYLAEVVPESYIEEIVDILKDTGIERKDIHRVLFNNYRFDRDLHKRPLSKLTRDILKQLNLYQKINLDK